MPNQYTHPTPRPPKAPKPQVTVAPEHKLVDSAYVRAAIVLTPGGLRHLISTGLFPAPLRFGHHCLRWPLSAIEAVIAGTWTPPAPSVEVAGGAA